MTDEFNEPGSGGEKLPLDEINGALLLVTVHEHTAEINTTYGPSRAIRGDVAVLDGARKGDVFADTLIFPRKLQGQLSKSVGSKVLGRLGQGTKKAGQNPPWELTPPTDADKETGRKYLAYVATQTPVAVVEPELEPF